MNDPSALPTAASAGLGALILTFFGVEPQTLLWSAFGAIFGASAAPKVALWYWALMYFASVCLAAVFGTFLGYMYDPASVHARNAFSGLVALFFHPLFAAGVDSTSTFVRGMVEAIVARVRGSAGGNSNNGGSGQ